MVDIDMIGCCWIEVPADKYLLRHRQATTSPSKSQAQKAATDELPKRSGHGMSPMTGQTRCQIEVDIAWDNVKIYPIEGEWSKIAPIRILSFDIECSNRKGF